MAKEKPAGMVSSKQLAEVLDCTVRQVEKYAEEGLVVKVERGTYHFLTSVRNVVIHLRKQASNNMGTAQNGSVADENILFRRSQRRISELKVAQLEGKLISVAEVEEAWTALVAANRQLMLSLPGRARLEIPGMSGQDQKALATIVHDMLATTALGEGVMPPLRQATLDDDTADIET